MEKTNTTPGNSRPSVISTFADSVIIIALATLIFYWYALSYEIGYLSYFHIPFYFASLIPSIIVYTTSWLWLGLLFFSIIVVSLPLLLAELAIKFRERRRRRKGEPEIKPSPFWTIFFCSLASIVLLYILFKVFNAFYNCGKQSAEYQVEFPVFKLSPPSCEAAIIRNYGEYLYAVPFDRDKKTFKKEFIIIKMSDITTPFSVENIGKLKEISPDVVPSKIECRVPKSQS